jgi:plasmid stability protein
MTLLSYNGDMDRTIRNLDGRAYRALKARAAAEGKTVGQLVSEAIASYLARPVASTGMTSLADLTPVDLGPGSETLSEELDTIVYGDG